LIQVATKQLTILKAHHFATLLLFYYQHCVTYKQGRICFFQGAQWAILDS